MKRNDFRFFHPLRVRWVEVDMQKIVFNAHYLMYFDTAISDYWRALGMAYEESMVLLEGDLYVKKASIEYHGSARFDDRLDVALKCERIGKSSMVFSGAIFRGESLLISSELIYVFADPASQTSKAVPDAFRDLLMRFEAGRKEEPMVSIKLGSWADLGADAAQLRTEVFVHEQGVPIESEWDEADAAALHAVAYNGLGHPVGCGRLLSSTGDTQLPGAAGNTGKIGRMAVKRVLRGTRIGRELLQALVRAAKARGDHEIVLHAQCSAESFYSAAGFTARGGPFEEVDIPHVEMFKRLA